MNLYEGIRVALMSLVHNKMRSFLTMLGVIIGVAAVIIVVAIGQGLKKDTMARIERMGTYLLRRTRSRSPMASRASPAWRRKSAAACRLNTAAPTATSSSSAPR